MAKTGTDTQLGTAEGAVTGRALHTKFGNPPVLDDTWAVHLLTPEGRVIDLPTGATLTDRVCGGVPGLPESPPQAVSANADDSTRAHARKGEDQAAREGTRACTGSTPVGRSDEPVAPEYVAVRSQRITRARAPRPRSRSADPTPAGPSTAPAPA